MRHLDRGCFALVLLGIFLVVVLVGSVYGQTQKFRSHEIQYRGIHSQLSKRGLPHLYFKDRQFVDVSRADLSNNNTSTAKLTTATDTSILVPVNGPTGGTVRGIAIDHNSGRMFLATDGEVYTSADFGLSWEMSLFPSQLHNFIEPVTVLGPGVIVAETDFSNYISWDWGETWYTLYEDLQGFAVDSTGLIYAGSEYSGIRSSADAAETWTQFALDGNRVRKVVLCPDDKFIAIGDSGVFYSDDKAQTWIHRSEEADYYRSIVCDSRGNLLGLRDEDGYSIFRSTDFGESWQPIELLNGEDAYRIYVDNNDHVLVTTFNDIQISNDVGATWNVIDFKALSLGRDHQGHLLAGNFDGLFRYDSLSGEWEDLNNGIHGRRIEAIEHTDSGSMIVLSLYKLFRSDDSSGNAWHEPELDDDIWFGSYAPTIKSSSGAIYIAAYLGNSLDNGLVFSEDDGITWQRRTIGSISSRITGIAEGADSALWLSTYFGAIYHSTDPGTIWRRVAESPTQTELTTIFADHSGGVYATDQSAIYITRDAVAWDTVALPRGRASWETATANSYNNLFFGSTSHGVYHSDDLGVSWRLSNNGLHDTYVMSSAADDSGNVVLGTSDGMFRLVDSLPTWGSYGEDFPVTFTTALNISPEGHVYVGTQSFGMYKSVEPLGKIVAGTSITPPTTGAISQFVLFDNYPNPFNGETNIQVAVRRRTDLTLEVFNVRGQRVAEIVDARSVEPGYHVYSWDGKSYSGEVVASGVYFYQITAGSFVRAKKMILLK